MKTVSFRLFWKTAWQPVAWMAAMTCLWTVPFFIRDFLCEGLYEGRWDHASYVPYVVYFECAGVACVVAFFVGSLFGLWQRCGYWRRFAFLWVVYVATVMCFLYMISARELRGEVAYFGGDPEGSCFMLTLPSAICYLIIGLAVGIGRTLWRWSSKTPFPRSKGAGAS
jgi:hypothetical protein